MRHKLVLLIGTILLSGQLMAQELDAYKYIIVPKQYDFQKGEDRFQLNSLTKFLFTKKGFTTLMEGERQPDDLRSNPCLGAKVNLVEISSMLSTKLRIELNNCYDQVVLTTEEGKSKIKDLKRGYHDALRKAFRSVQELDYRFDGDQVLASEEPKAVSEPEVNTSPVEAEEPEVAVVEELTPKPKPAPEPTEQEETPMMEVKETPSVETKPAPVSSEVTSSVLYAQALDNGYQLVDNTPKIVFIALKSSQENRYYLQNKAGMLFKKGDSWYAEYYKDGVLITEELSIKF